MHPQSNDFAALALRAEKGDQKALEALRPLLDDVRSLVPIFGDVAARAQKDLILTLSGENLLVKETVTRQCESLRAELAGPAPTPLESSLVERVVLCWLSLNYYEMIYTHVMDGQSVGLPTLEHYQRRISLAHNRYLAAIRTLAQVRRLALPMLQVNIGEKQVNVAGNVQVGLGSNQQ